MKMANLDWVSPLDEQRGRGENSNAIRARAALLREFGHWGFAEVLEDEADFTQMLEQKIADAARQEEEEKTVLLLLPRRTAWLVAAEAKEATKLRPQYAALQKLSEAMYGQLR